MPTSCLMFLCWNQTMIISSWGTKWTWRRVDLANSHPNFSRNKTSSHLTTHSSSLSTNRRSWTKIRNLNYTTYPLLASSRLTSSYLVLNLKNKNRRWNKIWKRWSLMRCLNPHLVATKRKKTRTKKEPKLKSLPWVWDSKTSSKILEVDLACALLRTKIPDNIIIRQTKKKAVKSPVFTRFSKRKNEQQLIKFSV